MQYVRCFVTTGGSKGKFHTNARKGWRKGGSGGAEPSGEEGMRTLVYSQYADLLTLCREITRGCVRSHFVKGRAASSQQASSMTSGTMDWFLVCGFSCVYSANIRDNSLQARPSISLTRSGWNGRKSGGCQTTPGKAEPRLNSE